MILEQECAKKHSALTRQHSAGQNAFWLNAKC
jgi:hypothetical protein